MTDIPHKRFAFDTVFDDRGGMREPPARPKRSFTPEDVEAAKAEAFAQGERSAVARAEQHAANALNEIAGAVREAFSTLAAVATAARSPPFTRTDSMPPKPPVICRAAAAGPAKEGRPG